MRRQEKVTDRATIVSVVIPAFNEEGSIAETILALRQSLSTIDHEIIVVDDGSEDATAKIASKAQARVVSHPHNLGYGASIKTGVLAAKNDIIVIMDADGTYPPEQVLPLLNEYRKGFNMVVGARTGIHYYESIFKFPLRLFLKMLVEFTAGRNIPDINSGLRVFSRKEVIPYFGHLSNTFSFTTSLTLAYMMTSRFVSYIPIPYHKRIGRTKVRLFHDTLRTLQFIVQAIVYYNPLKLFVLLFGAVILIALLCFGAGIILKQIAFLYLGVISTLVAILIFGIGLLAELLKQIMSKE